jgi:GR25 family glycosyltransferase involved in LPS biosynthesis
MRGCILSQIEILKISNERGYKSVLIIEDDVIFHPNFGILWDKLLPKVQALEYDIFYGYDWYRQKQDDIENPIELSRLYRNLCTHFVVFNGDFVPKAIELQEKSEKRGVPLDITFNDNSNILMVAPSCNLVGQDEGNSLCCGGEYRPLRWRDSDG